MHEEPVSLEGIKVMIGSPVHREIAPQTSLSLIDTALEFAKHNIFGTVRYSFGCAYVEMARSIVVHYFLESDATHLLFVDSDMTFAASDAMTVVALCTKLKVVGCAYPARKDPPTWYINAEPGIRSNSYGCLPVKGMGLGFTCVERSILQSLSDNAPKLYSLAENKAIPHIFRNDSEDGAFKGEDMCFFADVKELGYQPWLWVAGEIGHIGQKEYRASFKEAIGRMKKEAECPETVS